MSGFVQVRPEYTEETQLKHLRLSHIVPHKHLTYPTFVHFVGTTKKQKLHKCREHMML